MKYAYKKPILKLLATIFDAVGSLFYRPPDSKMLSPKRILVVRLDQMGDLVQTIPFFESLRTSFPESKIHFLTNSLGWEVFKYVPYVDEIATWNCPWFGRRPKRSRGFWRTIKWIRSKSFDCAFELRGDVRLITMLRFSKCRNIVGYGATGGGFLLDVHVPWEPNDHAIDRNLRLLESMGGRVTTRIPKLRNNECVVDNKKRFVIHPDAGTRAKRWPPALFAEVINGLEDWKEIEIVLIGSDKKRGEEIVSLTSREITNLMGKTSFSELMALMNVCCGMLSNDSGPAHLMASIGKPVWVIWSGTAHPHAWAPRGDRVKLFSHPVPCSPCSLSVCPVAGHPCMTQIPAGKIVKSISGYFADLFMIKGGT